MVEQKHFSNVRKERFEFKLTVNDNIICQRYFKINNFNENSLSSLELKEIIDECVNLIDEDLKSKTRVYMYYTTPTVIVKNKDELFKWLSNPNNLIRLSFGDVFQITEEKKEYWWNGTEPIEYDIHIDDNEYVTPLTDEHEIMFKFSFLENGKEIISKAWDGRYYPKFVRNGVDLSNKKSKYDGEDVSRLPFEGSVLHHMISDKNDLVPIIIKLICDICSETDKNWHTMTANYGDKIYQLSPHGQYRELVNSLEKSFNKK